METEKRYSAKSTANGTWSIFDSVRGVTILQSVSPRARYNEDVVREIVDILNEKNTSFQSPTTDK